MTASTRLVWWYLQSRESLGVAGQDKIAAALGLTRKTVGVAMKALTEAGIIERHRRGKIGGGRKGDFIHMRQTSAVVGEARQGRFFVASRPRVTRTASGAWMSMIREFVEPWQRARGRQMVITNRRQMVGQWQTIVAREPDHAVRAAMVRRYLAMVDPYLSQADYPLGLMLVRWSSVHHGAQAEVLAETRRRERLAAASAVDESLPSTGTIDAGAVARFRARVAR